MTERRDAAPDGGTTPPEDVPPTPEDLAPDTDEDVLEADIAEDITAPHPTVPSEPEAGAAAAGGAAAPPTTGRGPMRPGERRAAREAAVPPSTRPAEPRVRIDDRASRLFVLASIATFAAILLYGLLLGQGGFLSGNPSPSPAASGSASAGASASPGPSASPSASPLVSPSASQSASPSVAASPSVSPSAGTSPSPSVSATSGSPSPS